MPLADYLSGVAFFAGTAGALARATTLIARRRLPHLAGAPRTLAVALIFTAALIAAHLVALALGVLTRGTALASAVLIALGASRVRPAAPAAAERDPGGGRLLRAPTALALAIAGTYVAGFALAYATTATSAADFTLFHLPGVARWIQTGTVWRNNVLIPDFPVGAYPNNGDVVFAAAVLPWRNDAFVRLVNIPYLALVALAVYAIARELRAPRATAALMGAVVVATETVMVAALDRTKPETMMLACLGGGVLFLLRHGRTRRSSDLVLAGLGLGLAFGARWDGAEAVAVIFCVWLLFGRLRPRAALTLGTVIALAGGFWLLRNLVVTGDPLFPLSIGPFHAPQDPVRARYGHTVAGYLLNGAVLRDSILPAWRVAFGAPGALLGLGLVAATAIALRRRSRVVGALALSAIGVFVLYLITPGSAQGFRNAPWPGLPAEAARWSAPALLIAGALGAWAAPRRGYLRTAFSLAAVLAVIDGLTQSTVVSAAQLAGGCAGLLVVVALRRAPALLLVVALIGGQLLQSRFNHGRYGGIDPTIDWVRAHAPAGHRVGIAGAFRTTTGAEITAMFGPRLHNSVAYVGYDDGGFLRQYHVPAAYGAALRRGRYDLVLVARGDPPRPGTAAETWTAQAGYRTVAASARWALFALRRDRSAAS